MIRYDFSLQISDLFRGPDYDFCLLFQQAMVIDFDGGNSETMLSTSSNNTSLEDTMSKGKNKETKKVSYFILPFM